MGRRLNIHYFPFRSRYRGWILAVITIVIAIAIAIMTPHIKVAATPELQTWQIDGIVAALEDPSSDIQAIALAKLNEFTTSELQKFPTQSNKIATHTIARLKRLDDGKPLDNGTREITSPFDSLVRSRFVFALERLGKIDDRIVKQLTEKVNRSKQVKSENDSFTIAAARILVDLGKADSETIQLLFDRAKDSRPDVTFGQDSAILALENLGKSDPKVIEFLFDRFRNAEMFKTRATAAEVLINLNQQDKSVMQTLLETIQKPPSGNVTDIFRSQALSALGHLKKADSSTIDLLFNLFTGDDYDSLRGASNALVSLGKVDNSVVKRLSEMVISPQEDTRTRYKALIMLGEIRKADSRIFPVLKDLIHHSQDPVLQIPAANLLVIFQDVDRHVIKLLENAIADPNPMAGRNRINAAKILGEIQPLDFNQLGTFLQTVRESDFPDMDERRFLTYYYNRDHHNLHPQPLRKELRPHGSTPRK
jgi:hypothetical protein